MIDLGIDPELIVLAPGETWKTSITISAEGDLKPLTPSSPSPSAPDGYPRAAGEIERREFILGLIGFEQRRHIRHCRLDV